MHPDIKKEIFFGEGSYGRKVFLLSGNANDEGIRKYVRGQLKEMDAQEEKWKQLKFL